MIDTSSTRYQIIVAQFPVARLFGHNLLVLRDPANRVIGEANGLATSKHGTIKPIGYLWSDRLKGYVFPSPRLYRSSQPQAVVFDGTEAATMDRWQAVRRAIEAINALNLGYPILGAGRNSNSLTSTLIAAMGLAEPLIPGARRAPGQGRLLLPADRLAAFRHGTGLACVRAEP